MIEFVDRDGMEKALDTLDNTELNGRKIKLVEDKGRGRSRSAGSSWISLCEASNDAGALDKVVRLSEDALWRCVDGVFFLLPGRALVRTAGLAAGMW